MGDDGGMSSDTDWLRRYRRGERAQVWHELRQLGSRVREPGLVEEAELVCDEMAHRARHNIELLVERLDATGYRFHTNDVDQEPVVPFVVATEAAADHARWLDDTFGPVPLTMLSWVRLVGDVWLVGTHPQAVDSAACDPLVIEIEGSRYPEDSMRDCLLEERDIWREQLDDPENPGLFALPVAPDRLHKDNVSGGRPYGIVVADSCADALFVGETTMPFVAYLNWVFANGGFPHPAGSGPDWWRIRGDLAEGLLPL